jgi:hypothetical protein
VFNKIVHGIGKIDCGLKKVERRPGRTMIRNLADELNLQTPIVRSEIR